MHLTRFALSFRLKASINFSDGWWFPAKIFGFFLHMYILLVRFSGALPFRSGDLPSCKLIMPNTKSIHQTVHDIALWFFSPNFCLHNSVALKLLINRNWIDSLTPCCSLIPKRNGNKAFEWFWTQAKRDSKSTFECKICDHSEYNSWKEPNDYKVSCPLIRTPDDVVQNQ